MISGFDNSYSFLSNFYPVPVAYKGIVYDNAESAYQAQKCKKVSDKKKFIGITGRHAKKLGREIEVIDGWDSCKHQIMFEIVLQKFLQNQSVAQRLLDTKNEMLVETNYWHDNYWGNCECDNCKEIRGMNNLGFILMHVRYILETLHPKYDAICEMILPEKERLICPMATPFAYPRCMSFDSKNMTCTGLMRCKDNPYKQ